MFKFKAGVLLKNIRRCLCVAYSKVQYATPCYFFAFGPHRSQDHIWTRSFFSFSKVIQEAFVHPLRIRPHRHNWTNLPPHCYSVVDVVNCRTAILQPSKSWQRHRTTFGSSSNSTSSRAGCTAQTRFGWRIHRTKEYDCLSVWDLLCFRLRWCCYLRSDQW